MSLEVEGPFAGELEGGENNLVLKAANLLAKSRRIKGGARIRLIKKLPVASGIGGGSADAAATLRGLARLWRLDLSPTEKLDLALSLGSDVPACLSSSTAWIGGRGEQVTKAEVLPRMHILLVNPGVPVSTAAVFARAKSRGLKARRSGPWDSQADLISFLKGTGNDLEEPAKALAPEIAAALDAIDGASGVLLARMSGSGATCFGLFPSGEAASIAAREITNRQPRWWVVASTLGG
ncbi:MAG: 4-(cytidine 5'-diphospho)-2-C-methyl-D-erythritol kinase [Alphaproteobacteria bacterium]|nr:4-(cytidine 5'-diphospho)-2-C-methyl-D-erythritol kinase [Alphaproteobacteria bacterium]